MMQYPVGGHRSYDVAVYNREVRQAVKENRNHDVYGDQWADTQIQGVTAANEAEARRLATLRFPAEKGFVVEALRPSPD